jgi:AraC-like DNA-binding protein
MRAARPLPVVFLGGPGLQYEAHAPPPALAPWVHAIWRVRATAPADLRVLPDGCVDLIDGDVVGPFTAAALFRVAPGYEARGVRLRPGAFPELFGVPASELLDERVPVAELLGRRSASLPALAADAAPPDPLAEAAMRAPGAGALARASGYSPRHLRRRLLAATGLTPKRLGRIGRMQRALSAGRGESWARTAVEHGWYDEAHMANDVRDLAGRTPHALLGARSPRGPRGLAPG